MILLENIDEILELVTSNTSNLDINISYRDVRDGTGSKPHTAQLKINSAGTTTILTNPPPGTRRYVDYVSIVNTGASANQIKLQRDKAGTNYEIVQRSLGVGRAYKNIAGRDFFDEATASGGSGVNVLTEIVTADDFLAYQVANGDGTLADSAITGKRDKAIGVILLDTLTGFTADVVTEGEVQNIVWGFTPGDIIYLNGNVLSNVPPVAGFTQIIAVAKTPDTIIVGIKQSIRF